jgi:hypothetical protein
LSQGGFDALVAHFGALKQDASLSSLALMFKAFEQCSKFFTPEGIEKLAPIRTIAMGYSHSLSLHCCDPCRLVRDCNVVAMKSKDFEEVSDVLAFMKDLRFAKFF